MGDLKTERSHCNRCLNVTNNELLFERERIWEDREGDRWRRVRYQMLLCRGCETVGFRTVSIDSEAISPEGEPEPIFTYYPPEISRREPSWLHDLWVKYNQPVLHNLLVEVYTALQQDLRTLAAAGVRTIIDTAMTTKVGDKGTFGASLKEFEQKGFIALNHVEFLKNTLDAGSASAHRAFTPSRDDLNLLLDIAENLIEGVFIYPERMKDFSKRVPRRRRKK